MSIFVRDDFDGTEVPVTAATKLGLAVTIHAIPVGSVLERKWERDLRRTVPKLQDEPRYQALQPAVARLVQSVTAACDRFEADLAALQGTP